MANIQLIDGLAVELANLDFLSRYDNFDDAVAEIGSAPKTLIIDTNSNHATTTAVPDTLILDRWDDQSRITDTGGGFINFAGVGMTKRLAESTVPLFVGFSPDDINWTGSAFPPRLSSNLWADANWDARLRNACAAFSGKRVTIVAYPGGTLTAQVEVFQYQCLYLTKGHYLNSGVTTEIPFMVMNDDTEVYGDGMGQTWLHESPHPTYRKGIYSKSSSTEPYNGSNDNLAVHDLGFWGTTWSRSDGDRSAINLGNGRGHRIENIRGWYIHTYLAFVGSNGFDTGGSGNGFIINNVESWGACTMTVGGINSAHGLVNNVRFNDVQPCLRYVVDGVTNGTTTVTSASANFEEGVAGMDVRVTFPGETVVETKVATYVNESTITLLAEVPYSETGVSLDFIGSYGVLMDFEPNAPGSRMDNLVISNCQMDATKSQQLNHFIGVQTTDLRYSSNISIIGNSAFGKSVEDMLFDPADVELEGADTIHVPRHAMATGQKVLIAADSGTLAGGLDSALVYWIIRVDDDNVKLALSYGYAANGMAVTITSQGTGRQRLRPISHLGNAYGMNGVWHGTIANNTSQGCGHYAIAAQSCSNLKIANNTDMHPSGISAAGMFIYATSDSQIVDNTIAASPLHFYPIGNNILEVEANGLTCNTAGTLVTLTGYTDYGTRFRPYWKGKTVTINSVDYVIDRVLTEGTAVLTTTAGTQTGVSFATKNVSSNTYSRNKLPAGGSVVLSAAGSSVVLDNYGDYRKKGTVTVDLGSVAANTVATQTFTLTGAAVGDNLILNPPALTAGLVLHQYRISAASTVSVVLENTTGSAIDEGSGSWNYTLFR